MYRDELCRACWKAKQPPPEPRPPTPQEIYGLRGPNIKPDSVPIEPFRNWINNTLAHCGMPEIEWCKRNNLTQRRLWALRNESKTVELKIVDRVMTSAGVHMWEIYPELY